MASLLEQIGWARERDLNQPSSGGVSYYSPAAPVRAPGQLASSATPQRILGGGATTGPTPAPPSSFRGAGPQLGATPQGPQGPGPQLGQVQAPAPITGGSIADQMLARLSQQKAAQPEEPSGFMGALGTVANSLPGKIAMGGLQVLDLPRRAVVSGIGEMADAVAGDDASFGGWWEHFRDPNFGMGDLLPKTGNIWLDRAAGFTGDVVFDPTTYLAGSGVVAGMGRGVRATAAARLMGEGFGEEIASRVGRYGYSSLDDVTRATIRKEAGHVIEEAGYRFKFPGQKVGWRIPGTGGLEKAVTGISSRIRYGTYKIPGMSRLSAWRTPEGLEAAFEKMLTGRGAHSMAEAAEVINFHEWHKVAANTVHARLRQQGANLLKGVAPGDMGALLRRAESEGGTEVNTFFDDAVEIGQEYGLQFHGRKKYVPHFLRKEAVDWMKGETPQAKAFRTEMSLGSQIEDISPILMERKMVPRAEPYDIMGRKLQITNGTIEEWNDQFAKAFPELDFKLMDDDLPSIMAQYLVHFPDDVGTVAAAKRLASSKSGLITGYHDEDALREIVDEVATTRMTTEAGKKLKDQVKLASDLAARIKTDTMHNVHGVQGLLGVQMRGALDELTTLSDETRLHLGNLMREEEDLSDQVGAHRMGPDLYADRDRLADEYLVRNQQLMDAQASGDQVAIDRAKARVEEASRRMRSVPAPAPGQLEPPLSGRLDEAFGAATREIDTKIAGIDAQMLTLHRRALAEQKLYSEGEALTRGRRMADLNETRKARDLYEDMLAARASAEMDRQTIFAIQDRIKLRQLKQQKILTAYDNPSMLSLMAGERVNKPMPRAEGEVRTPDGNYRVVGHEPVYAERARTPQQVRRDFQQRREALLNPSPEMIDQSAAIEVQEGVVARADADLAHAVELHGPIIDEAKTTLKAVQDEIDGLESQYAELEGMPGLQDARDSLRQQINTIKQGRLNEAQEAYDMVARPVMEANSNRQFAIKQLDTMKRRMEENAQGSTVGGLAAPQRPEAEELPYTPQRVGAARAQVAKDDRVLRQWRASPDARRVRDLEKEVEDIMREWRGEKQVLDLQITGPHAPFKLDGNGNIVPAEKLDPLSKQMLRRRDEAAEVYHRAAHQVEILEDLTMQGEDHGDELFRAIRERDEAKAQFDSYNNDLIRERLERYTGTEMERRMREAIERQKYMSTLEKGAADRRSQVKKIKRKISPVEDRMARNRQLLDEQAAAVQRNAALAQRPGAVPPSVSLQQKLARLNRDEVEALRRADEQFIGYRPVLEDVPTVSVATPERAVPLSNQYMVDQHFAQMTGHIGRRPTITPDEDATLRQAYLMLRDGEFYKIAEGTDDPISLQVARAVIKDIESRRGAGWSNAALATRETLDESVAEVERIRQARMIFEPPVRGSPQELAINQSMRMAGGSHMLADRAKHAWSVVNQARARADELVSHGAMNSRQIGRVDELLKELDYNMRMYAGDLGDETNPLVNPYTGRVVNPIDPETGERRLGAPSVQTGARLEQNVADAQRVGEFLIRYSEFVNAGGVPSPAAAAYVLGQGLRDEVRVLDAQIKNVKDLLGSGLQKKWARYEATIAKHNATIAEQESIVREMDRQFEATGFMDKRARKQAQQKAADARVAIKELKEPDTGFIDQEIRAIEEFVTSQVMEVDDAVSYLRNTRDLRRVIDYPHSERARLEETVPYYAAQVEEMKLSRNRRRQAITKAVNEGSDTVTFSEFSFPKKISLTIEQAEEMLPSYPKAVREQVQQAITAARKADRTTVSIGKFDRQRVTMPLDQAQEELDRVEQAIESLEYTTEAARLKLSVFTGEANVERDALARKIEMIQGPIDPNRIQVLQQRLARREQAAAAKAGGPSEGDLRQIAQLRDDLELATNPPSAEDMADLVRRHKQVSDAIKGIEDAVGGDMDWLQSVMDGGQSLLTRLLNGEAAPTRSEMNILRDLLGGEAGDVASQYINAINDVLARYGNNLSTDDLVDVYNAVKSQLGADEGLTELFARNVFAQAEEGGGVTVDRFKAEVINAMVAAAKTKHSDELRRFAEMFDMMGLRVFSGRSKAEVQKELDTMLKSIGDAPTPAQESKIRLLKKELDAPGTGYTRKSMLQAMGYNMSRQQLDQHKMRQFIIQQFSQQGFDPVESLRDRLLTLQLRRQRTRTMIRGLGGGLNEPRLGETPFRIMYGEAVPGQVPAPPADVKAEIEQAVEVSKQLEPEPTPPVPEPATSGTPMPDLQAEFDQVANQIMSGQIERGTPEFDAARARMSELQQQMENPQPAAAAEPPEVGRVEAIQAEIDELDAAMAQSPSNISEMLPRYNQLKAELEAAQGAEPAAAAIPPAAAAPPAGKPPKPPTMKASDAVGNFRTDEGWEIRRVGEGQSQVFDPEGNPVGDPVGTSGKARKIYQAEYQARAGAAPPPEAVTPPPAAAAPEPAAAAPEPTPPEVTQFQSEMEIMEALQRGEITMADAERMSNELKAQPPEGVMDRLRGALDEEAAKTPPPPGTEDRLFEISNRLTDLELTAAQRDLTPDELAEQAMLYDERSKLWAGPRTQVDPVVGAYGPEGMESAEFLQHAEDRNLSPKAYAELLRHQARKMSRPDQVIYDWESVLFKNGPRFDVARGLRKTQGPFDAQVRRIGGAAVRPSGAFTRGMLPEAAKQAAEYPAAIRRAQETLVGQYATAEQEIEDLTTESVRLARQMEEKEFAATPEGELGQAYRQQIEYMQGADVRAEAGRINTANQSEQRRLQVERAKLGMERYNAEQSYNKALNEADLNLGHVRSAIVAAHHDVAILDSAKNQIERALNTTPQQAADLGPLLEDLRQVNRMREGMGQVPGAPGAEAWSRTPDQNDIVAVEAMIDSAIDAQMKLNNAEITEEMLAQRLKNFENAASPKDEAAALGLDPVMERIVKDGWQPLAARLLTDEDSVYVTEGLARALKNAKVSWKDENFWRQVEKYTAFFKTYATATPGFHVRNALSSLFMNAVAGVRVKHLARAPGLWKAFRSDPKAFWAAADEDTRVAFAMVFGSGAGGQFLERGVGPEMTVGGRLYQKTMNNMLTRFNRRMGEWVEGPVRLAMALDSVDRGQSMLAGVQRITHYHFNYNEVSRFDRAAKRMIPFWTFMSRNFPMQIMEMWTHPRTYLHYQSFVRNFSEPGDPLTPEYWLAQGAFTMDENAEKSDSPWYLAPDLPHLRVAEPLEAAMQGDWGKALLSDINPAVAAPLEAFGVHKKFYTGAPIEGYSEPEGAMKLFTPLFNMLGATETGGKTGETLTPESWQHILRTMLPTVGLAERLTSGSGVRAGRQGETVLRALGAPVYKLTPELREQTKRSQLAQKREKYQTQVDLARS